MESKEKVIFEEAIRQFSRFGYRKTSLDDIAREARTSKRTIYKYSRSKLELFQKCAENEFVNLHNGIQNSIKSIKNPIKRLIAIPITKRTIIIDRMRELESTLSIIEEIRETYLTQVQFLIPQDVELVKETLKYGVKQKVFNKSKIEKKAVIITEVILNFDPTWWRMDDKAAKESIEGLFQVLFEGLIYSGGKK